MRKFTVALALAVLLVGLKAGVVSGATERLEEVSSFDFSSPRTELGPRAMDLAWDGEHLWATFPGTYDNPDEEIYELDTSGNIISSFDPPGPIPYGITWDGEHLWVTSTTRNRVYKLDTNGNLISSFGVDSDYPFGLTWDGEHLWVNDSKLNHQKILEYDTSGNLISSFDFPWTRGLTWDGEHLWAVDGETRKIYKLNTSGNVISVFHPLNTEVEGLAWDGEHLWVSDLLKIYEFRIATYYSISVSAGPSEGGSVTLNPPGENYENGTEVMVTAAAAEGYAFQGWTGDVPAGHENDNPLTLVMDSDKTLTANFLRVAPYTLALLVDPSDGGSVTLDPPGGTYSEGTVVTLTAVPAENYEFAGWSGDASGTSPAITLTMDSDKSIVASFSKVEVSSGGEGLPLPWVGVGLAAVIAVVAGVLILRRAGGV